MSCVEEIRRELDADGDLRELLKDRTSRDARVVARPACDEHDAPPAADDRQVRAQLAEHDLVVVEVDAPAHRVRVGIGLLVDLLLHEAVELALHDLRDLDLEHLDRVLPAMVSAARPPCAAADGCAAHLALCARCCCP